MSTLKPVVDGFFLETACFFSKNSDCTGKSSECGLEQDMKTTSKSRKNTTSLKVATANLPQKSVTKILRKARKLPAHARPDFIRKVASTIAEVSAEHPRTIIFAAAGTALGEYIDQLLVFKIPFRDELFEVTADKASHVLFAAGALLGFSEDRASRSNTRSIQHIIRQEFEAAAQAWEPQQ